MNTTSPARTARCGLITDRTCREESDTPHFCTEGGTRTGYVFFDLADRSDIAEPLFQDLKATVEFFPAMNTAELRAGLAKASAAWT